LTFDSMYDVHKKDAEKNLGVSLETIFEADFDGYYRSLGLPDSARRAQFISNSNFTIDFLMAGSYTIESRGKVILTVALSKYLTGEMQTFSATGAIREATQDLAHQVFDFFQSEKYPDWVNPQPQLTWIVPTSSALPASTPAANQYCRGQGARFPYTRELIQASQGSQYRPGGIPALGEDQIYPVSDR